MKKTILVTSILFISSVFSVIGLYFFSEGVNHRDNSFIRLFPPHPVLPENNFDIKYNSYYIAGVTKDNIYLGNFVAPTRLLRLNTTLTDTQHIRLEIKDIEKLKLKKVNLTVDSPYFYFTDGIRPAILRGRVGEWQARRYMYDSAFFTEAIPISATSYVIRAVNRNSENVLGKLTKVEPHVRLREDILVKQVDGLFCTDGMLHFNKEKNVLTYLYYYRNQYLCMDTSLNILYKGKTIDTVSHAKIKVASIRSENSITMASPPLVINKKSCVAGNYLFVNSNLLARNENKELFDQASVIDVYNLKERAYIFSFYLFNAGESKLRTFKVHGDLLVALYDHHVLTYKLVPKYFKH